jgi:hypothetical protein
VKGLIQGLKKFLEKELREQEQEAKPWQNSYEPWEKRLKGRTWAQGASAGGGKGGKQDETGTKAKGKGKGKGDEGERKGGKGEKGKRSTGEEQKGKGKTKGAGKRDQQGMEGSEHKTFVPRLAKGRWKKGEVVGHITINQQVMDGEVDDEAKIVACSWEIAKGLQRTWQCQCEDKEINDKVVKVTLVVTEEKDKTPEEKGEGAMQKWVETEGKGPRKLWCLPPAPRHGHPAWPQECQVQTKKLEVKEEEKEMVALRFIVPKEYVTKKE